MKDKIIQKITAWEYQVRKINRATMHAYVGDYKGNPKNIGTNLFEVAYSEYQQYEAQQRLPHYVNGEAIRDEFPDVLAHDMSVWVLAELMVKIENDWADQEVPPNPNYRDQENDSPVDTQRKKRGASSRKEQEEMVTM